MVMRHESGKALHVVVDFLARTLPFSELPREALEEAARRSSIDFVPRGVRLMTQGQTRVDSLALIQSGGVKLFLTDQEGAESLVEYRGEGAAIGALAIIRDSPASLHAETVEDTFFLRLDKAVFRDLLQRHPSLAQYYLRSFSEEYIAKAFSELRRVRLAPRADASLVLFSTPVGAVVRRQPVTVFEDEDIRSAAQLMTDERVGCLLVRNNAGAVVGIITDKDLRTKVVSQGLNSNWPVAEIMSTPLATIPADESCFNALLFMMRRHIHHLPVASGTDLEGGPHIVGLVTADDILVLTGSSPFGLYKEMAGETRLEALRAVGGRVAGVVRRLVEEGARAGNVARMLTILHDLLAERLLALTQEDLAAAHGSPPVVCCWLALGESGRRERVFDPGQGHALVYVPATDPMLAARTPDYLAALGQGLAQRLEACGQASAAHAPTAAEAAWRKSLDEWRSWLAGADAVAGPEVWDFRGVAGDPRLAQELRASLTAPQGRLAGERLRTLAGPVLAATPPLSFFRDAVVEADGTQSRRLDLARRGLEPMAGVARVLALASGVDATSTEERLAALGKAGVLPLEVATEAQEAWGFLQQLRLVHQLRQVEAGLPADAVVRLEEVSALEKRTLSDVFGLLRRLQELLAQRLEQAG